MSEVKVNKISPRSGTTVTLGDSGDTFTIPSGATISNSGTAAGFGPLMSDISFWFSKRRGIAVAIAASGNYFSGIIWPTLISSFFPYSFDWRFLYISKLSYACSFSF